MLFAFHSDRSLDALFPEFAVNSWLLDKGLTVNDNIPDPVADDLITELGLSDYMDYTDKCNVSLSPYNGFSTGNNGKE